LWKPGGNDGAISLQVNSQAPPYAVNWISGREDHSSALKLCADGD